MLDTIGLPGAFELVQLSALGRLLDKRKARREKLARAMTPYPARRELDRRRAAGHQLSLDSVLKTQSQQPTTELEIAKSKIAALRSPLPPSDFTSALARLQLLGWKR